MVLGVEVSWNVLLAQRLLLCRCGRCGELKSCGLLFGHLPTLNVGKMWVIRRGLATHILPTFDTHARLADALFWRVHTRSGHAGDCPDPVRVHLQQ